VLIDLGGIVAKAIKRIEKEVYLKNAFENRMPLYFFSSREEYSLTIDKNPRDQLQLRSDRVVKGVGATSKMNLTFNYWGNPIAFTIEVMAVIRNLKNFIIVAKNPEVLFKDLERAFVRVAPPAGLKARIIFPEEQYALDYPRVRPYESVTRPDFMPHLDAGDLRGIMRELYEWAKGIADGCKIVLFKDKKIDKFEERILWKTGRILYLPAVPEGLPSGDPSPRLRIITGEGLMDYLKGAGVREGLREKIRDQFIQAKIAGGACSEAWVPILFQEYAVGYIRLWTTGIKALTDAAVETAVEFTKLIAFSLKTQGYFASWRSRKKYTEYLEGKIIDVSASGILFTSPGLTPQPGSELAMRLETPGRTILTKTRVVRRFVRGSAVGVGCRFEDMDGPVRDYFFEYIYGKPFSEGEKV
jgi:hypothetical protein